MGVTPVKPPAGGVDQFGLQNRAGQAKPPSRRQREQLVSSRLKHKFSCCEHRAALRHIEVSGCAKMILDRNYFYSAQTDAASLPNPLSITRNTSGIPSHCCVIISARLRAICNGNPRSLD
jgi:hypothetical protein